MYISHREFTEEKAEQIISTFDVINHWIEKLPLDQIITDQNIAVRVLRFITSRNTELSPITTAHDPRGYVYPLLEPMFAKQDIGTLETLAYLKQQHLLTGRFFRKARFCSHCDSAFLNYEEQCPDCNDTDLKIDELVHHFKCAYTGELSEFQTGSSHLSCPKCEQNLRHIGVDYDKPSIVYHCNACAHVFQDPQVISACYNCGRQAQPENQTERTIEYYSVTSLGQNAALYGMESLFTNILSTNLHLTKEAIFRDFLALEHARINRYKISTSSLTMINIKQLDEIYIRLGAQAKDVFQELSAIFKSVLRTSDIITAINETVFIVLMTETNAKSAERAVERLRERIISLMTTNLDITPVLNSHIKQLTPEMNIDALLEAFLHEQRDVN